MAGQADDRVGGYGEECKLCAVHHGLFGACDVCTWVVAAANTAHVAPLTKGKPPCVLSTMNYTGPKIGWGGAGWTPPGQGTVRLFAAQV